jgi:hypothetical protein
MLSRSARLCESIIRHARARKGGVRECGRPYLARRLGCSTRQVSRYVAELRDAGRLHVTPPRRHRTPKGWRTSGVNAYRLTCQPHPAPHIRRSGRGDTLVTPPLTGSEGHPLGGGDPHPNMTLDPRAAIAAVLARHGLAP